MPDVLVGDQQPAPVVDVVNRLVGIVIPGCLLDLFLDAGEQVGFRVVDHIRVVLRRWQTHPCGDLVLNLIGPEHRERISKTIAPQHHGLVLGRPRGQMPQLRLGPVPCDHVRHEHVARPADLGTVMQGDVLVFGDHMHSFRHPLPDVLLMLHICVCVRGTSRTCTSNRPMMFPPIGFPIRRSARGIVPCATRMKMGRNRNSGIAGRPVMLRNAGPSQTRFPVACPADL